MINENVLLGKIKSIFFISKLVFHILLVKTLFVLNCIYSKYMLYIHINVIYSKYMLYTQNIYSKYMLEKYIFILPVVIIATMHSICCIIARPEWFQYMKKSNTVYILIILLVTSITVVALIHLVCSKKVRSMIFSFKYFFKNNSSDCNIHDYEMYIFIIWCLKYHFNAFYSKNMSSK